MHIYQAIVLAIIQGVAEFIPVSSSGHLIIVRRLLGWNELSPAHELTFDVALHFGTLLSVLFYFRRTWFQIIRAAFGGKVVRAPNLMHGKTSEVKHDGKTIFKNLPSPMTATRYHSLIVEEKDLPEELEISASTTERDGSRTIMGLRHRKFPVEGVQFHPESVLTNEGKKLMQNFLNI